MGRGSLPTETASAATQNYPSFIRDGTYVRSIERPAGDVLRRAQPRGFILVFVDRAGNPESSGEWLLPAGHGLAHGVYQCIDRRLVQV
jgi:hypothetical protein